MAVTQELVLLGRLIVDRGEALTAAVVGELVPLIDSAESAPSEAALRRSVAANIATFGRWLSLADAGPAPDAPEEALHYARLLTRRGFPLTTLLLLYHRAHNVVEQHLLRIVGAEMPAMDAQDVFPFLHALRERTGAYIARVTEAVAAAHDAESERHVGDPVAVRQVQEVLDARGVGAPDQIGSYPLCHPPGAGLRHVAVIVWATGEDAPASATLLGAARAVARVAGEVGSPLVVFPDPMEAWAWLTLPEGVPAPGGSLRTLRGSSPVALAVKQMRAAGLACAVGSPEPGAEGFARSFRRARAYQQVARVWEEFPAVQRTVPVVSDAMPGVGIAAAFAGQLDEARDVVVSCLGPVLEQDRATEALRETLRAVLAWGPKEAAERLVVHRNTVKYRVDRLRELLGDDALARPELRVAVELVHWFGPAVLPR